MKKHLKESADEYDIAPKMGIHPISKTDTKIIDKLTSILVGLDADKNLISATKDWKSKADEDILIMLEEVELSLEQDVDSTMKNTIDFVSVEGVIIAVKTLFSVEKRDSYDNSNNKPVFKIILNSSENPNVINGNKEIVFDDWADREIVVEELRSKLTEFTNIRFL
jgi:hypothetical protein